jgi:Translation elongation factor Ts
MAEVTSEMIKRLRERTGAGLLECRAALDVCELDENLAVGYLRFRGIAVRVKPREGETDRGAYERHIMELAKEYAEGLTAYESSSNRER